MSSAPAPLDTDLLEPARDRARIHAALAGGRRLVACLCAGWCSSCTAWHDTFAALAREFTDDCFVWIDIEDHDELVSAVEVETLPVLLVEPAGGVAFVGPVEPRASFVRSLLARDVRTADAVAAGSGVRAALLQQD